MSRRRLASLVLVALVAGCGSKPADTNRTYALEPTRTCLRDDGFALDRRVDFVASTASGGAVRVFVGSNRVTISFAGDEDEAKRTAQAYERFAAKNVGVHDILERHGNAVLLWREHPFDFDRDRVVACLREDGGDS